MLCEHSPSFRLTVAENQKAAFSDFLKSFSCFGCLAPLQLQLDCAYQLKSPNLLILGMYSTKTIQQYRRANPFPRIAARSQVSFVARLNDSSNLWERWIEVQG
jgi:hypothetical protein